MKKLLLVATSIAITMPIAQAAPTVYGKVFMTLDSYDTKFDKKFSSADNIKTVEVNSNASRIGFRGAEPLNSNTNVIYQLEYGVNADDSSSQFSSRNTYLGLDNKNYGKLIAGRMDTPFRTSKGNVDVFNAYTSTFILESGGGVLGEIRANNVIKYESPKIKNIPLTFSAAVSLAEDDTATTPIGNAGRLISTNSNNSGPLNNSISNLLSYGTAPNIPGTKNAAYIYEKKSKTNGFSSSLVYDKNGIYGALAYDKNISIEDSAWRITGIADLGQMNLVRGLTLGAMYQNVNVYDRKDASKTWLVSGKYKVNNTPWSIKAQYINTDNGSNSSSSTATYNSAKVTNLPYLTDVSNGNYLGLPSKITEAVVGGEYAFNKQTTGVIYAGQIDRKDIAKTTIIGGGLTYSF